jgi:enterochelin esterase-like enzyme/dienelactone hydrolase
MKNVLSFGLFFYLSQVIMAQKVIQLYEGKPKGSENWTWTEASNSKNMFNTEVVYNVSQPTITAYLPPKEAANGTAMIVAPGGAFHTLSINSEGVDVAKYLNSKGVAAFVLKYRVVHSNTDNPVQELMGKMGDFKKLDEENAPVVPLAMADGLAAVKYVRDHAAEMNIKSDKIGFIGFSAGATLAMSVMYNATDQNRPNFVAPIYVYGGAILGSEIPIAKTPIFVAVASDDQLGLMPHSLDIYKKWADAKQPAELHVYEKGGHGFGMRTQNIPTDSWYERFGDWMKLQGFLPSPAAPSGPFQRIPTPNDTLKSTRILADGRVVFSIYAPEAKSVSVNGDFPSGFPSLTLSKDFSGIWAATTKVTVKPNLYTYDFTVDGIKTFDPKNAQYKESSSGFSNIFEIKGAENDFQSLKNVSHGKIEKVLYTSTALDGITRRLHVYTPPNYETLKKKGKLPVLYLFHGGGDNDASWTTVGRANLILDNLYAEGKLKQMIVVMPAGHTPIPGFYMGAGDKQDPFGRDMVQDIIPFIEKNYPVSAKREHRAIAGLSMGGIQAINIALWNPQLFGYLFPMSTGYFPDAIKEINEKHKAVMSNPEINKFKNFKIYMGGEGDIAFKNNLNMMKMFDDFGIKYSYENSVGNHTFLAWRKNLYDFAPLLFK